MVMNYFKTKLIVPHYAPTTSDHRYVTDPVMWSSVKEESKKVPPVVSQVVNYRRFGKFAQSFLL
jgi:hypothetical protein